MSEYYALKKSLVSDVALTFVYTVQLTTKKLKKPQTKTRRNLWITLKK
jgi:hypothetical protein